MNKTTILILLTTIAPYFLFAQTKGVTISGKMEDKTLKTGLAYVNIVLKKALDSTFVSGTITNEEGLFTFTNLKPGLYAITSEAQSFQRQVREGIRLATDRKSVV